MNQKFILSYFILILVSTNGNINNEDLVKALESSDQTIQESTGYIRFLINGVYRSNIKNGPKIIKFLDCLNSSSNEIKYFGYRVLFDNIKSSRELWSIPTMMLAYRVKEILNREDRNDLKYITDTLPSSITSFPWNSEVTIQNVQFREFLYADHDGKAFDNNRRRIFTLINSDEAIDCNSIKCTWEISTNTNGTSFNLKYTQNYNEFLYADHNDNLYDKERRRVFSWRNDSYLKESEWQFEPIENTKYFRIKNSYWNEYLYAGDGFNYDNNRRRVFLWRPGGCDGSACQWIINKTLKKISETF